jgi:hypothetical protein
MRDRFTAGICGDGVLRGVSATTLGSSEVSASAVAYVGVEPVSRAP